MKKRMLFIILIFLLLLSACSAAETEAENTENDSVQTGQITDIQTDIEQSETAKPDHAEEESLNESEDEYGIMTLPLYIGLSVSDITDGIATVQIDNRSGYDIEYDLCFTLEREIGADEWERLDPVEEIAAEDVLYELPDLQQATITCDLNPYGDLPDGHYRIEKDDIYAEFTLLAGSLAGE